MIIFGGILSDGVGTISCPSTSNLAVSNITANTAMVSFDSVAEAVTYNIRYRSVGSNTWNNVSAITTLTYTITGLQSGFLYEFEVQTVCNGSNGNFISGPNFTTI